MILLPNCNCCCEPCCRTVGYFYEDSVPPGKLLNECPNIGGCDAGTPEGSCAGEVLEGHLIERFCKKVVGENEIRAKLIAGSALDDYGVIAGISTTAVCGRLGMIEQDHDITDEVEIISDPDDNAFWLAKVPISVTNARVGGPYGAAGVWICWCCKDPEATEPCDCCAGLPPPPPPPPVYVCLCNFPPPKFYTQFEEPTGQCAVNYFGSFSPWSQAKVYTQTLPAGVSWKPGSLEYLSGTNPAAGRWSFVVDEVTATCCCAIPAEYGSTLSWSNSKRRVRLLAILCPEDPDAGDPYYEDWTYLVDGDLESETDNRPAPTFFDCEGTPECYDFPGYLDDDPPVCQEFFP